MNPSVQLGAQFGSQDSAMELEGSSNRELTSMTINNYHGVLTVHGGTFSSTVRPFFMVGLGATQYLPSDVMGQSIDSEVKFSGTLGGGVKLYGSEKIGFSLSGRWTPTYIKSDPAGMYCSPYWSPWWGPSCVVLEDTDYSNHFEFAGGIIFRL